ncbi:MAG: hypothetical protein ACT4PJ_10560 [Gemmatimonadaceae bacterium]
MGYRNRRGVALVTAIFALVLMGVLAAGLFFVTSQEVRVGRSLLPQPQALAGAEVGQNSIMAQWDRRWNTTLRRGSTATRVYSLAGGGVDTVRVTNLDDVFFYLTSHASVGASVGDPSRRRTSLLVRLRYPDFNMLGAVTGRGETRVRDLSSVDGNDTSYASWNCPQAGPPMAGLAVADTLSDNLRNECLTPGCYGGSPGILQDAAARDTSTYTTFGDLNWNDLVGMATKTYADGTQLDGVAPSVSAGVCSTGDSRNWGDNLRNAVTPGACETYFPIIYGAGELRVRGGRGQGILLVNKEFRMEDFTWDGLIIVRGEFRGRRSTINGGLMVANANEVDLRDGDVRIRDSRIRLSRCTILKALAGYVSPVRARDRAWAELF